MTTLARTSSSRAAALALGLALALLGARAARADIPGRITPAGPAGTGTSGANPGTQQQELPNITFPAPYNVFEFVVTCMACHGGTVDQSAGHGGNWGGTNMASAARDPVFRANQVLANNSIRALELGDGAGNVCMRCHSPNGWMSGRFDPQLGGAADGSDMIQSILLSTDGEGISCEFCHRAMGAVRKNRVTPVSSSAWPPFPFADLTGDLAFNMLAGILDWPHQGRAYPQGPGDGNPFGDATLQFHDGMGYVGKYSGSFTPFFADTPLNGTRYTGQTYGFYPSWWSTPGQAPLAPVVNPDGSYAFQFDVLVGPPLLDGGGYDYQNQSISVEHPTRGGPQNDFIRSPEFCGSCHDLTVPVLNHGMPEQRTYTEWKYSSYGPAGQNVTCQACHMPPMRHEYADNAPVSLNPDPTLAGWYPYGKDRNPNGGTSFHKLVGANRDLPDMMKFLYPEVDLEVVGAPTGHDPSIFPGMFSDRGPMWDRARRNTEISLRDAASVAVSAPVELTGQPGTYQVKVTVTNNTGHRIPSGYPDGRRMWVALTVSDNGAPVYRSGYYDEASSTLFTDAGKSGFARARSTAIDGTSPATNAVMVYERGTCMTDLALDSNAPGVVCDANGITPNLLNKSIAFDNRIPPAGFDYASYQAAGVRFWNYTTGAGGLLTPYEDVGRFTSNVDEVTYTFLAPTGLALTARAELLWQTHSREFMDHLKDGLAGLPPALQGPRPEGPPNPLDPNYPLTPTYLSDVIGLADYTDMNGLPLLDNWGGIAYAAWIATGRGAPYVVGSADTAVAAPPAAPSIQAVTSPVDPATGIIDPNVQNISWTTSLGAEGYVVWVRYGKDVSDPPVTADWDRLAVVRAPATAVSHVGVNPGKTFQYAVQAFNAAGLGAHSASVAATTPAAGLLGPINTRVAGVTSTTVALTWFDQDFSELGFVVERQDVPLTGPLPPFQPVAYVGSQTPGGATGGNAWTDGLPGLPACGDVVANVPSAAGCYTAAWTALQPGRTYNYQVSSYNAFGISPPDLPVAATTLGTPLAPTGLTAAPGGGTAVVLAWTDNSGNETGFRVERAPGSGPTFTWAALATVGANTVTYTDGTTGAGTTYSYRVFAVNAAGDSLPSNTATITTPAGPPAAPTSLVATPSPISTAVPTVTLTWVDAATNETGFYVERSTNGGAFARLLTGGCSNLGANVQTCVDGTVAPKTTYTYRVQAWNASGVSAYSNTATAVTPGQIPEPPSNLRFVSATKNSITISWTDNATNERGFYVERAPASTGPFARVGSAKAATGSGTTVSYTDKQLAGKTTYWYRVQAYNADGVSAYTDPPVSGTTK